MVKLKGYLTLSRITVECVSIVWYGVARTGLSYDSSGEVRVFVNLATCNGSQITSTVEFFFLDPSGSGVDI